MTISRHGYMGTAAMLVVVSTTFSTARTWTVASDGAGDFEKVSEACAAAASGDTIAINPGTYEEADHNDWSDPEILVSGKSLLIRGGGDPKTVVLALRLGFYNCTGGVTVESVSFRGTSHPINIWGGTTEIRRCRFEDNRGAPNAREGGAIGAWSQPEVLVEDCYFARNSSAGSPESSRGGAIAQQERGLTVRRCVFVDNSAAGIGGAIYCYSHPVIEECVFWRNEAPRGAAVALGYAGTLLNCTFWENRSVPAGGESIVVTDIMTHPDHCIVGRTIDGYGIVCEAAASSFCSDYWANDLGPGGSWFCSYDEQYGNISVDPGFCDPAIGDFGLRKDSPCVPGNHGGYGCDVIGARGVGCGWVSVEKVTWGRLKTLYR